ncbi:peptide methionine sulfoxide reductase MsrA [Yeosuana aromativorans]|uniref:Peptide methionine sulfoxide reductase MsrA n=1 Tax=Yeosuana aromativorans TaxID=288019 RepID=A0A8J3FG45_9FLAO|nr:peptide-methionine (S)-S-oxide reductase MsrA [Yeosuana aromativorans]GGK15417.1 peptide methionine sulfoxide reductase MsrA [Yeosuana aromativorans]
MEQNLQVATFAGGCFWCTEAVFNRLEGVERVVSGYTGGHIKNPAYREICTGRTGHAEAIQIFYDQARISYKELLEIFFATHDPTTLNRQGNDVGTQYRSAIFFSDDYQRDEALDFIRFLEQEQVFKNPITTEVVKLETFYNAEDYHQDYYNLNKDQPYCQFIINPKIKKLKETFTNKLKKQTN